MDHSVVVESPRGNLVDRLRDASLPVSYQILAIMAFAGLTAFGAQFRVYLWEVPFTLQTLFVYSSGLFLGSKNGMRSMLLYLGLGMFFPVFAGDGYGPSYLLGAVSIGFLLAFPIVSFIVGKLTQKERGIKRSLLGLICGSIILFSFGVFFYHIMSGADSWFTSLNAAWLRFIPVDLAKIMAAGLLYQGARKLF